MPELLRKKLLPPGDYVAPQGTYSSNANRARRQVEAFRKLKAEGFRFPVPWGHRLSAVPQYGTVPEDEYQKAIEQRAFEEARYNAGYLEDLDLDPDGTLVAVLPVPPGYTLDHETGDLINPSDGTRIREVSGAFGDWQDGKGRLHKDILIHAALCVRPVWGANQPGFELASRPVTLSTWHTLSTGAVRYTQLGTQGAKSMAKNKDNKPDDNDLDDDLGNKPADDELDTDGDYDGDDNADVDDDAIDPEPAEPTEPEPVPVKAKNADHCEQAIALLNQAGLQLPGDTTEDNFCERLVVALTTAISMGAKFERQDEDASAAAPASGSTAGAQPPAPEAASPEPPPATMMSGKPVMLATQMADPAARNLAEGKEKEVRQQIVRAWKQCRKLGVPVSIADRQIAKASRVQLSFTPEGKHYIPAKLSEVLLVKEIMQAMAGGSTADLTTLSTATDTITAVPSPIQPKPNKSAKKATDDSNESPTDIADKFVKRHYGENARAAKL